MSRNEHRGSYTITDVTDSFRSDLFRILDTQSDFRSQYLRLECFSKFTRPDAATAKSRRDAALTKWLGTEARNRRTNIRLYGNWTEFRFRTRKITSEVLLDHASAEVRRIIGCEPPEDIHFGMFSGGASSSLPRRVGRPARKFSDGAHVTRDAVPYLRRLLAETEWGHHRDLESFEVVEGNVLFTVPKTSEIDRVAAKEPDVNLYLQKGAGDYIRHRLLRRAGINLNDQTVNQRLAAVAVRDGLATVDLSSASDSVTTALVYRLLPPMWASYLDDIRSKKTCIDGTWHENEMFSSMGNGFTFELESLLFFALAKTVTYYGGWRGKVSVYGDDIIVPSAAFKTLKAVFGYFGFIINPKKSYATGLFRESCGAHFFGGQDVKPFYIKEPIASIPRLIHALNSLRRWAVGNTGMDEIAFYRLWTKYAKLVPERFHGGCDTSDIGALVTRRKTWTERKNCPYLRKGYYKLVPIVDEKREPPRHLGGAYLAWLNAAWDRRPLSVEDVLIKRLRGEPAEVPGPLTTSTYDTVVKGRFRPRRNVSTDVPQQWLAELVDTE